MQVVRLYEEDCENVLCSFSTQAVEVIVWEEVICLHEEVHDHDLESLGILIFF